MKNEDLLKLQILLEKNPKSINQVIDEQGNTWLHKLAEVDIEIIEEILSKATPDFSLENNEGYTPLHLATIKGNLGYLELIHKSIKNVEIRTNKNGGGVQFTALHLAILHNHSHIIIWLVENKANINALVFPSEEHSLSIAGKLKFVPVVKYLLEAGSVIPDDLPKNLANLYKKGRPHDEGFSYDEWEIIGSISYFEGLHYYMKPEDYPKSHFNYATRFLSQDYTSGNNPKIVPSLKHLVMTKISFFNTYTEKKVKLDTLPKELQNLYSNLTNSWMNNTSFRPDILANFYYAKLKQKLSALLELDLPYSHTAPIGQYLEVTHQHIGNTLKQLAAIHKNKKLPSETKLKLFDDELMNLIQKLNRKESENKGIKEKNLHKDLTTFLEKKEMVASWGYKLNLLTKLEVLKAFVKNLGQQAGAEYVMKNSKDTTCNVM